MQAAPFILCEGSLVGAVCHPQVFQYLQKRHDEDAVPEGGWTLTVSGPVRPESLFTFRQSVSCVVRDGALGRGRNVYQETFLSNLGGEILPPYIHIQ